VDDDFGPVLPLKLFQRQIQMQLTGAAQYHLLRIGIAGKAQRRILLDQFMQSEAHLIHICTRLGFNGKRQDRPGQRRPRIADRLRLLA
jgi:hypothetical protein